MLCPGGRNFQEILSEQMGTMGRGNCQIYEDLLKSIFTNFCLILPKLRDFFPGVRTFVVLTLMDQCTTWAALLQPGPFVPLPGKAHVSKQLRFRNPVGIWWLNM